MRNGLAALGNGLAALVFVAAFAAFAAPASAAPRCKPGHDVLARKRGQVVIWTTLTRQNRHVKTRVYVCVSRFGSAHVVDTETGNVHPKVTRLQVAGNFVGFFLATAVPFGVGPLTASGTDTTLYVFDAGHRRVDLRDLAVCASGSTCASVPVMTAYALAANGWVTELYTVDDTQPQTPAPTVRQLVATYAPGANGNTRQSVSLDFGSTISGLSLSGGMARWTGDLSGAASAVLGPTLVPSSTPQATSGCQLLTTTDLSPLLGQLSSSGSASQCQYTGASRTLSLSFKAGLSSQQVKSDASALNNTSGVFSILLYDDDYSIYLRSITISGVPHEQLSFFSAGNGSELSLDLTAPSGNAAGQLPWLANVAFDRLFGVPVQRTN